MESLKDIIKRHEGFCARAYQCPAGRWTIGYGRNIEDLGITQKEAEYLLDNDIARVELEASMRFPWFSALDPKRRDAITCMIFQLGLNRFAQFKKMIAFISIGDFNQAADEATNSLWAKQTPQRAREISDMLRG